MMTVCTSLLFLSISLSSGIAITLRSRIRGSNRFIPFSSCSRRSDAAIGLTRLRPDAEYNKGARLRQAPLQRNAEPITRPLIASTAQLHPPLAVTESAHRDRLP